MREDSQAWAFSDTPRVADLRRRVRAAMEQPPVRWDGPLRIDSPFMSEPLVVRKARTLFRWYNHEHHHNNLGLMTLATVHHGQAQAVCEHRQQVLFAAYAVHPERFVCGVPAPPALPKAVWINGPQTDDMSPIGGKSAVAQ